MTAFWWYICFMAKYSRQILDSDSIWTSPFQKSG